MKNKDLVKKLQSMNPESYVRVFYGPSDEWIRFSIDSNSVSELSDNDEIVLDVYEVISKSDDWDEIHPGF